MSSIATSSCRRAASPPRRRPPSPHARQTRRSRRLDRKRRRRQTRQARAARRKLQHIHQALPQPARSLFDALAGAFTRPTFLRFVVLALAAILTIGRPHRLQPPAHPRRLGSGPSLQLPPRLLQAPLVLLAAGPRPGRLGLRPPRARRPRPPGRRRHRRRAPRRQGLRQGLPPRPGPLHALLHRLPLGAQVGRAGRAGPLPLRRAGRGPCPCWWPCIAARRTTKAAGRQPQDAGSSCCGNFAACCCAGSASGGSC